MNKDSDPNIRFKCIRIRGTSTMHEALKEEQIRIGSLSNLLWYMDQAKRL